MNQRTLPIPVKEGEIYPLTIIGMGSKGDGIARIEGYVIIIPEAEMGRKYEAKITAVRGKQAFAKIIQEF